jgi:hypothetical protein
MVRAPPEAKSVQIVSVSGHPARTGEVMKLVNLCPHPVTIVNEAGRKVILEKPGPDIKTPRVEVLDVRPEGNDLFEIDGLEGGQSAVIELSSTNFGNVIDLPEENEGVVYVVGGMILDHPSVAHRRDLVAPGDQFRDPTTHAVVGCRGLRTKRRNWR